MTIVSVLFFSIGMIALAILWDGYVLFILWGWFVVPIFGLSALTVPQAIGVSLIIGLLTHQYYATPVGKDWDRFQFTILHPTLVLIVAWVVKQWMSA